MQISVYEDESCEHKSWWTNYQDYCWWGDIELDMDDELLSVGLSRVRMGEPTDGSRLEIVVLRGDEKDLFNFIMRWS